MNHLKIKVLVLIFKFCSYPYFTNWLRDLRFLTIIKSLVLTMSVISANEAYQPTWNSTSNLISWKLFICIAPSCVWKNSISSEKHYVYEDVFSLNNVLICLSIRNLQTDPRDHSSSRLNKNRWFFNPVYLLIFIKICIFFLLKMNTNCVLSMKREF